MGLLSNLFDPDDHCYLGNTYAGHKLAVAPGKRREQVLALLNGPISRDGAFVHLNAPKDPWGGLSSSNTVLRSLLFELDNASLSMEEQLSIFQASGLPFSSAVSSGNKSLHVVISLAEPLTSLDAYRELHARCRCLIGHPDLDRANGKPTVSTKVPGGQRRNPHGDDVKEQKLYYMGTRVPLEALKVVLTTPEALARWAVYPDRPRPKKATFRPSSGKPNAMTQLITAYLVSIEEAVPEEGDRLYTTCPCCNAKQKFCVGRRDDGQISFSCFKGCDYDQIKNGLQGEEDE